ncbi:heme NO-binding domain-containing protein [Luteolibacter algae]|uniref:Heme NO-binding domain-containing protein n=1 Tax=Luteolibacter algae TaxID=454151 RepID=A0ABW5D5R6_9BACT
MYGMVNKAVQDLVITNFGDEKWDLIKQKAGVEVDVFLSNESYPDEMTYDLVEAASEVLGVSGREVLHAFGEHWVLQTARQGYGSMLEANGRTLPEFLINLPTFHTRVAMIFPDLKPPRFNCTDIKENSLLLHYHSHRPGLTDFVIGLLQGLGKMFNTSTKIVVAQRKAEGADHDVFAVSWVEGEAG